jgi:hypothetical protein
VKVAAHHTVLDQFAVVPHLEAVGRERQRQARFAESHSLAQVLLGRRETVCVMGGQVPSRGKPIVRRLGAWMRVSEYTWSMRKPNATRLATLAVTVALLAPVAGARPLTQDIGFWGALERAAIQVLAWVGIDKDDGRAGQNGDG